MAAEVRKQYCLKRVYLTFDDGPSENTLQLLDILDENHVKAAFFVTAITPEYADVLTEIARRGHVIGVHTFSHDYQAIYASEEAWLDDFVAMQALIQEKTGAVPEIFRFPGGSSNTVSAFNRGIMTRLTALAEEKGLTYYDWNVTGEDVDANATKESILANVMAGIRPHLDSLVLLHDTVSASVEAVGEVIRQAEELGCTFLPLDENAPTYHHRIAN